MCMFEAVNVHIIPASEIGLQETANFVHKWKPIQASNFGRAFDQLFLPISISRVRVIFQRLFSPDVVDSIVQSANWYAVPNNATKPAARPGWKCTPSLLSSWFKHFSININLATAPVGGTVSAAGTRIVCRENLGLLLYVRSPPAHPWTRLLRKIYLQHFQEVFFCPLKALHHDIPPPPPIPHNCYNNS